MRYALVSVPDNTWASGPYEEEPATPEGQRQILVPFNFPEKCYWSAELNGFVDIAPAPKLQIIDFLLLFTPAEFMAIKAARATNPNVDYFWTLLDAATNGIRLDDPLVTAGIGILTSAGLISSDRAAAIVAGTPPS